MIIPPSNPPTAPSSPTPSALPPTTLRAKPQTTPKNPTSPTNPTDPSKTIHIPYVRDIQPLAHPPPKVLSPSLIVPSFLRPPALHLPPADPNDNGDKSDASLGSRGAQGRSRGSSRQWDEDLTTRRGSSAPGSVISSLALPRRIDLSGIGLGAGQGVVNGVETGLDVPGNDGMENVQVMGDPTPPLEVSTRPLLPPSLVPSRKHSSSTKIGIAPPGQPGPSAQYQSTHLQTQGTPPSPEINWAETLPRSMQGLQSLGGSTARPPLRPDQLGLGMSLVPDFIPDSYSFATSRHIAGVDNADGGNDADVSIGSRTERINSRVRHLEEYKVILQKLGTNLSLGGSGTARPGPGQRESPMEGVEDGEGVDGPMGEHGMIRIGDAEIPRMPAIGPRGLDPARRSRAGVRRVDVDELGVEWCWFCEGEYARDEMVLKRLNGHGEQWVCWGCDGRGEVGDGERWDRKGV